MFHLDSEKGPQQVLIENVKLETNHKIELDQFENIENFNAQGYNLERVLFDCQNYNGDSNIKEKQDVI